jgi:hypothetical protein
MNLLPSQIALYANMTGKGIVAFVIPVVQIPFIVILLYDGQCGRLYANDTESVSLLL